MQSQVIDKFPIAVGSTGPVPGDATQAEHADALVATLLTSRYYVAADGVLVLRCIDERLRELLRGLAGSEMAPNAAGATMSLTIADILIGGEITGTGTLLERHQRMIDHLQTKGLPVGAHLDSHDHTLDGGSGCGACDKLSVIFAYMVDRLDDLRSTAKLAGIDVDDETHEAIRDELRSLPEFARGAAILEATMTLPDGAVLVEKMLGVHDALAAVVNFRFGTTLNRQALADEKGLTAFNIDAWAFEPSAKLVYGDKDMQKVRRAVAAMTYYNFATSAVLCNQEMRIVIRR